LANEYNVFDEKNVIRMDTVRHDSLHSLFGVLLTPKEQLMELRALYDTILDSTSKKLFDELLALPDQQFYIQDLLKTGKHKNR